MERSLEDAAERAFQLAFFIHPDRRIAREIAERALKVLDYSSAAQDRRRRYSPIGRQIYGRPRRFRSKVCLEELQLLQALVYRESEPFEIEQEHEAPPARLSDTDFIVRFVKLLVQITTRRSSFYVALGLSRLLHNYTTADTIAICDVVRPDPECRRADEYCRKQKAILMRQVLARFGKLLRVCRSPRGEERFEQQPNGPDHARLVRECLSRFTLWLTSCALPPGFDPTSDVIQSFVFDGGDPDDEHPVERNRMHALTHPDCFERLVGALGLDAPDQRLAVPKFYYEQGRGNGGDMDFKDRLNPPELTEEELSYMLDELSRRTARRKRQRVGATLSIIVDGVERARFDPAQRSRARFKVDDFGRLIEVVAHDGEDDVRIAAHLLLHYTMTTTQPKHYVIVSDAGQQVSFVLWPELDAHGDFAGADVEISYRETHLVRAAKLLLMQLSRRAKRLMAASRFLPAWRTAAIAVIAGLLIAAAIFYVRSTGSPNRGEIVTTPPSPESEAPPSPQDSTPAPQQQNESPPSVALNGKGGSRRAITPRQPSGEEPWRDVTDAEGETRSMTGLRDVNRIYVEASVGDTLSEQFRASLVQALGSSGRFTVVEEPAEADAVLRWRIRGDSVDAWLTKLPSQTLWKTSRLLRPRNTDVATRVASEFVKALRAAAGPAR